MDNIVYDNGSFYVYSFTWINRLKGYRHFFIPGGGKCAIIRGTGTSVIERGEE